MLAMRRPAASSSTDTSAPIRAPWLASAEAMVAASWLATASRNAKSAASALQRGAVLVIPCTERVLHQPLGDLQLLVRHAVRRAPRRRVHRRGRAGEREHDEADEDQQNP